MPWTTSSIPFEFSLFSLFLLFPLSLGSCTDFHALFSLVQLGLLLQLYLVQLGTLLL